MVKKINAEQFAEAKKSAVALVDFYNVDVDDAPSLAAEYKVMSIPCLVLMKQDQFVDQSIGFKPEAQILDWIKSKL